LESFPQILQKSKKRLLQMHFESGAGHIGGNLSCLDILLVLYHKILRPEDYFVLSKGHSAGALYITLWSMGLLGDDDLKLFHKDGTKLSGHPAPNWMEKITFATGSLGHGFPFASGLALAKVLKREPGRVFCLTSDGEWEEGSNWEAVIFAAHRKLIPLTVVVDCNGIQGFGTTREVAGLEPLKEKLAAFGLAVEEIDGHDPKDLEESLGRNVPGPRVIIARTKKGKGVSFMENKMEWHYLSMTQEQYHQALREVDEP
jgi:transketolase